MGLKRFARIPMRRETLATRRLRARLARERQGPDGKWETNKKKREVRCVKKKCTKLQNAFERSRGQQLLDEAVALKVAKVLLVKLAKITKTAALLNCLLELEALAATSGILRKCQMIDVLRTTAKRCRKGKDERVTSLVSKWQRIVDDHTPSKEVKRHSSSLMTTPSTCSLVAQPPRYITPARPTVVRPSWKLGRLFSAMRSKHVAAEVASKERAQELGEKLQSCVDSKALRALLPSLQEIVLTRLLLLQVEPNLAESLEAIAKRCRMGKNAAVRDLLAKWKLLQQSISNASTNKVRKRIAGKRKILYQAEGAIAKSYRPTVDVEIPGDALASAIQTQIRQDGESLVDSAALAIRSQTLPSKQQKITAFLFGSGVSASLARLGA